MGDLFLEFDDLDCAQRHAVDAELAKMVVEHGPLDGVLVAAIRGLATQIDFDDAPKSDLWREYRLCWKELRASVLQPTAEVDDDNEFVGLDEPE